MASPSAPDRALPRAQIGLAVLGAYSILPPYLGPPLGLELNVTAKLEVVDHVVPGVLVAVCAGLAAALIRRDGAAEASIPVLALTGLCLLAGLWQLATHVPLVFQAGEPQSPWGSVVLHSSPGPLILALALWLTLRTTAADPAEVGRSV